MAAATVGVAANTETGQQLQQQHSNSYHNKQNWLRAHHYVNYILEYTCVNGKRIIQIINNYINHINPRKTGFYYVYRREIHLSR